MNEKNNWGPKNNSLAISKRPICLYNAAFTWGTQRFEQKLRGTLEINTFDLENKKNKILLQKDDNFIFRIS